MTVNPTTNRIYIENQGSNNVTVLDGATNGTTTVAVGTGPSTAALNPVTNKLYVANSSSSNISVVDGATNFITAQVTAGNGPDAVYGNTFAVVNPITNKIYVLNDGDNTVTVIDGESDTKISTIPINGRVGTMAINPETNKIYVGTYEPNGVAAIDGITNEIAYIPVSGSVSCNSLAVNPVTNKLYVASGSGVTEIDGVRNSTMFLPLSVADGSTCAAAVNPVTNKVYVTISSGNVAVIDGSTNGVTYVPYPAGAPYSIAVNPATNKIYVPDGQGVTVIDGATNNAVTLPATGIAALVVAINPITNKIYVPNSFSGTLMVIDGVTNSITTLPLVPNPQTNSGPFTVAVNPNTNKIYLPYGDFSVTVIDGATNTETLVAVPSASGFNPIVVNPATNKVYITGNAYPAIVDVLQEENVQPVPLTTTISPLPNNRTILKTPSFDFTAQSGTVTVPDTVYYQVDTWQNGWTKAKGSNPFFDGTLSTLQPGIHTLFAFAGDGQQATSAQPSELTGAIQAYSFVVAPPVTFLGVDTTTHGTWTGVYGNAGYVIANEPPTYLPYASAHFMGDFIYTWAGLTSDPRALQTAPGATSRIASAYLQYSSAPFTININASDGNQHQVALYLMDWDSNSRNETITVSDASTGQLYDTQTFSNFHDGKWAIWNIEGNLNFTITTNSGLSGGVSGIFFN